MSPPPRAGVSRRSAGVAVAALAALLAPAGAGAQVPGPPEPCLVVRPADGAAGDLFACALAAEAGTAAVGSVLDDDRGSASGSVYVFGRGGGGWAQRAKLLAADGAAGDQLGFAVGIAGGLIAAGAPFRDQAGDQSGAVYVFAGGGASWTQTAKLVPAGLGARDELGRAVAVADGVVAAGAPGDDDRGSSAGAVWVFELDGSSGGTVHKLTATDGAAGDGLGFSVALAGGTLLAGAPFADQGGAQAGAVYVFERQGSGWVQTAKLTASDRRASSLFGWSVALAGDRAAVGARLDDGAGANAGAAYVFGRAGGAWSQQAKLLPPGLAAGDELGSSVALAGEVVVAGARFGAAGGLAGAGAGWVFAREGGAWIVRHRLESSTPGAGDELGFAVGAAGGAVFAGAYRDDDAGADAGTFCVFEGAAGGGVADLSVTKTDGVTTVAPGGTTVYTITAANAGPAAADGARVSDDFPPVLACEWTCAGAGGGLCGTAEGSGDLDQAVTLPAGGSVTFTAVCAISPNAAGTITNTAEIAAPAGVSDPDLSDNSATDVDAVQSDFTDAGVSKSDGVGEISCRTATTYTVSAFNAGSRPLTARVRDVLPPPLTCEWTCAGVGGGTCGAGSGAGDVDQTVTLPVGAAVDFTVSCMVSDTFSGTLSNTATVTVTGGGPDDNPSNDSATDTDVVVCPVGLLVSKADGVEEVTAGGSVEYTITAINSGPQANGAGRVRDAFAEGLDCSWACSGAGGATCGDLTGTGAIDQVVGLPLGGTISFVAGCAIDPGIGGDQVINVVTIEPAGSTTGTGTTFTDINALVRVADVEVTKTADVDTVALGDTFLYTVRVVNRGPSAASPVAVTDHFPDELFCLWQCAGTGGGECIGDFGVGDIVHAASLPPDGAVTYEVQCTVQSTPGGEMVNTASAAVPAGVTDPDPGNDSATATVEVVALADLSIAKAAAQPQAQAGQPVGYSLTVANAGPDDAAGVRVVDQVPANLAGASWSCGALGGGSGGLDLVVDLPAGSSVACTVTGTTPQGFCGRLENTATVEPGPGTADPDPADNAADASTLIFPPPAAGPPPISPCASKDLLSGPHPPGAPVVYEILLFNGGPAPLLDGPGDEFIDELPVQVAQPAAVADGGIVAVFPPSLVTWNGSVAPGEVVTITITGTVDGEPGEVVPNQGQFGDADQGVVVLTDDPRTAEPADPTVFTIDPIIAIPTLGAVALGALAALLAAAALRRLRRDRT